MDISRRNFISTGSKIAAGLATSSVLPAVLTHCGGSGDTVSGVFAVIPMPIQVVIDDVGWWSGEDGNARQEPYRTGIARNHAPADYQAIVDLGRALNIRPQAAMILCEWDRENILRELPTSTWMGANWDNKKWVGPWLDEAAEIITSNSDHYEFTMHGIGHEYWDGESFTRAEWADRNGVMRPVDQVEAHLDYFAKLMEQNNLGNFPTSFVPTAFNHGFGPTGDHDVSFAEILSGRGINYINTPFDDMANAEAANFDYFGFDAGVITVDRGRDLLSWKAIGTPPRGELRGPTCGMHWPNLLHQDPERNGEIVEAWATFLKPYNEKMETLLAPNSLSFRHQLVHYVRTRLNLDGGRMQFDFSDIDSLPGRLGREEFTVKLNSPVPLEFSPKRIEIVSENTVRTENELRCTLVLRRKPGKKAIITYRGKTA